MKMKFLLNDGTVCSCKASKANWLGPDVVCTSEALDAERELLRPRAGPDQAQAWTALCLSGGGIRSAAFSLGVLQALAKGRLLSRFDYLSTVSGGGFIGGWLQVLISERGSVTQAEDALCDPQAPELAKLRSYTNYLTPEVGPFTEDTWTAIVLYLRNLLLNWLVVVPRLIYVVMALIMHRTLIAAFGRAGVSAWMTLLLGTAMLSIAAYEACLLLPSHRPATSASPASRRYAEPGRIEWSIVWPCLGWSLVTPAALHGFLSPGAGWGEVMIVPAFYFATMMGAYGLAWFWQRYDAASELFKANQWSWLLSTFLASAAIIFAEHLYLASRHDDQSAEFLTTYAPLVLTLCHMVQTFIYVGLRQERTLAELDREWLARLDGKILFVAIGWTTFALCCLHLSAWILPEHWGTSFRQRPTWVVTIATFMSGPTVAWLGKQAISRAGQGLLGAGLSRWPLRRAVDVLAVVFIVGLFALIGVALQFLLGFAQNELGIGTDRTLGIGPDLGISASLQQSELGIDPNRTSGTDPGMGVYLELLLLQIMFASAMIWLSYIFSQVNVNRFSMHGVYRNRLSRAFLGSALKDRAPEPFTGFGPHEHPRLAQLERRFRTAADAKLFPVVNIALNLTRTTHTAWAERKAAPFTATPLFCGSAELSNPKGQPLQGAYVPTPKFAGRSSSHDVRNECEGIRLSTVLTISGAAVSPNWGYNSSPLTAFLMTMFNMRLGAWLPNPARATREELEFARPPDSRTAIFDELMGEATDERPSIYLSDGGHFENLGLYEMLRRKCTRIVVVDAGQDGDGTFADLGNAIRKAEIDGLGTVKMKPMRILSRAVLEKATPDAAARALGIAVGSINYGLQRTGKLLYIKPSFLPNIPAEVRAYGTAHPEFPHESTTDQWFTESQFESYRALGEWQVSELTRAVSDSRKDPLERLFERAWAIASVV